MTFLVGLILTLTVWFDGVPVDCIVDTGSTVTALRASQAVQIGTLGPVLSTVAVGFANNTTAKAEVRPARHIGTSTMGWPGTNVWVLPDDQLSAPCLLGMDLLGRQPLRIDWETQTLVPAG